MQEETPIFPDPIEQDLVPMSRLEELESELWEIERIELLEQQHYREQEMLQRDWYLNGNQDHS
jgi:hypothetical protein